MIPLKTIWLCAFSATVMWGLDAADPSVAISAMRDINGAVRNLFFFLTFFLTGPIILVAAWLVFKNGSRSTARCVLASALVYMFGVNLITFTVNVPMNEALAALDLPLEAQQAQQVWLDYSGPWTAWNHLRTLANGLSLLLLGWALFLWAGHRKLAP